MSSSTSPPANEIHAACAAGDVARVRALLDAGVAVAARDANGWTPLHVAVSCGRQPVVELLLQRQAPLELKHNLGSPPLLCACNKPLGAIVALLLAAGAHPNVHVALGLTALQIAATWGQREIVAALLAHGARVGDVDDQGMTALHYAAREGFAPVVTLLLDAGAATNAVNNTGETPLHLAAGRARLPCIELLLESGADLAATDSQGRTALFSAAWARPEAVELLVRRGAAVNVAAARGVTPLHSAAREGFTRCVKALLDGGADVERRNGEGGTPLFSAAVHARKDTVALLVSRGANLDATIWLGTTPRTAMGKAMPAPLVALPMPPAPRLESLPAPAAIRAWIDHQRGGHPLLRDLLAARWQVLHDPRGRPGQLAAAPQVPHHGRSLFAFSERAAAEEFAHKIPGLPAGLVCTEADGPQLFFGLEEGHDEVVFDPPVTPLPFLFYERPLLPTLHRVGTRLWLERELDRNATPRAALWELANRFKYRALLGASRNLITVEGGGRTLLPLFTNSDAETAFFAWLKDGAQEPEPALCPTATGSEIFALRHLPLDGAVLDPAGPDRPLELSLEVCEQIVLERS